MNRGNIADVDALGGLLASINDRVAGLERTAHRHPTGTLDQTAVDARVIAVGDPRYVNVTGDNITGSLGLTGQVFTTLVFPGSAPVWSNLQFYASSVTANSSAGIGLRTGNVAITLYTGDALGNNLEVIDATNAQYRPVRALAFTVSSSERIKQDIEPVSVLDRIAALSLKRYRLRTRPQNYRVVDDVEVVVDHDCSMDECVGTADSPCCITANDTPAYGLIAEEVFAVFPEAVSLNPDLTPFGIDVNQIASLALGGVAELVERVKALEARR